MNALTRVPRRGWSLAGDFDDLVNGFFAPVRRPESADQAVVPAMDIVETDQGYLVKTDLPGIAREDLKVSVKDRMLVIEAESSRENVEKSGETVIRHERRSGKYYRSLRLGKAVDESAISAEYKDGVLTLNLPRAAEDEGRKIDIQVH